MKFEIVERAKRQARNCFLVLAIPDMVEIADHLVIEDETYSCELATRKRVLVTEKVLKFNQKTLKKTSTSKKEKVNKRLKEADDLMLLPVGKPGSSDRVAAMVEQYAAIMASGLEISIFSEIED